jgi:UDP-N-acetylmuramoylalanine--D-glutamate ligase
VAGERALVVGLGVTGRAAALALAARGWTVRAADRGPTRMPGGLPRRVSKSARNEEADLLQDVDVVVKSPGVPARRRRWRPRVRAASRMERARARLAVASGQPDRRRHGHEGEDDDRAAAGAMFDAAGREAVLAGNEHTPLSEVALSVEAGTWIVCEVSSFALEDVHDFSCEVAVLLNVEPDHLDRHADFEAYRAAKLRILERANTRIVPRGSRLEGMEFGGRRPPAR